MNPFVACGWWILHVLGSHPIQLTTIPMRSKPWRKRFLLHQSTQRWWCQSLFCCFALGPLLLTLAFVSLSKTPWYQDYQRHLWEERLSLNLDLDVHLSSIEFPSPRQFRIHGMRCFHPETKQWIANIDRLDGRMSVENSLRPTWMVDVWKPEINGLELDSAIQVVHRWFICRPQRSTSFLGFTVHNAAITNRYAQSGNVALQQVNIALKPTESETRIELEFLMANTMSTEPAKLRVFRKHDASPPITHWDFVTSKMQVPCDVLSPRFESLKMLGENATFQGRVYGRETEYEWDARILGTFRSVNLATLSTDVGGPISGTGMLDVHSANIRNGQVLAADVGIAALEGVARRDWVLGAIDTFGLGQFYNHSFIAAVRASVDPVRINQLGMRIQYQDGAIQLLGNLSRPLPSGESVLLQTLSGVVYGHPERGAPVGVDKLTDWLRGLRPEIDAPRTASNR